MIFSPKFISRKSKHHLPWLDYLFDGIQREVISPLQHTTLLNTLESQKCSVDFSVALGKATVQEGDQKGVWEVIPGSGERRCEGSM